MSDESHKGSDVVGHGVGIQLSVVLRHLFHELVAPVGVVCKHYEWLINTITFVHLLFEVLCLALQSSEFPFRPIVSFLKIEFLQIIREKLIIWVITCSC